MFVTATFYDLNLLSLIFVVHRFFSYHNHQFNGILSSSDARVDVFISCTKFVAPDFQSMSQEA